MSLPDYLPQLPSAGAAGLLSWPANVLQGYQTLSDLYGHALQALHTDAEPLRLQFHSEAIINDAFPLILAFEHGENQFPTLAPRIRDIAEIFIGMLKEFQEAEERAPQMYVLCT